MSCGSISVGIRVGLIKPKRILNVVWRPCSLEEPSLLLMQVLLHFLYNIFIMLILNILDHTCKEFFYFRNNVKNVNLPSIYLRIEF